MLTKSLLIVFKEKSFQIEHKTGVRTPNLWEFPCNIQSATIPRILSLSKGTTR